MAVAVIIDFDGGAEQYDGVLKRMELGGKVAPGGIFHAAGPQGDGWRVVDVWDSADAFQGFAESRIAPLSAAEGLGEPRIQMIEVDEMFDQRDGGSGDITLLQVVRLPGLDRDGFRAADAEIRDDGAPPEGCMFHINGSTDDGWLVADAWTSREIRDRFAAEKIAPAMAAHAMAPPTIEDLEIHNTLTAR